MTPTVFIERSLGCRSAFKFAQVVAHHPLDELLEAQPRLPSEALARLAGVADARRPLGGTLERPVDAHVALGVEIDARERDVGELRDRVTDAAGEDVVVGELLLQ